MSLKDIFILAVTSIFIICVNKLIFTNFLQPWLLIYPEATVSASLGLALSPATDIECDITPLLSFCSVSYHTFIFVARFPLLLIVLAPFSVIKYFDKYTSERKILL